MGGLSTIPISLLSQILASWIYEREGMRIVQGVASFIHPHLVIVGTSYSAAYVVTKTTVRSLCVLHGVRRFAE